MNDNKGLPELPEPAGFLLVNDGSGADGYTAAQMRAYAAQALAARGEGWRPIESCPYHRLVQLWIPEHEKWPWADMAWAGTRQGGNGGDSRNYPDADSYVVYTPYRNPDGRGVVCPVAITPTHWRELDRTAPAAPAPGESE